jgi:uncharacterized protein (DUF2235 family)
MSYNRIDPKNKRLIICADGTWNKPDQIDKGKRKPSNIVKLVRAIEPKDKNGIHQVVFYDQGVGTDGFFDKYKGGLVGAGLSKNIIDCYRFLLHNYNDGDEIYLFGFSRGAFTVRSLVGFISIGGLLPKDHDFFTLDLYKLYRKQASKAEVDVFRKKHESRAIDIHCLGVWDTVGSRGIPNNFKHWTSRKKYQFHDTRLSDIVKSAFHAVSIDERRKPFKPTLWEGDYKGRQVEQKWFAGVHSNIGGGYEPDGLANITLNWMVEHVTNLGLQVNNDYLKWFPGRFDNDIQDSMKWYYRIFGKNIRPIIALGKDQNASCVHETAIQRFKEVEAYKPVNLKEHLESIEKRV